MNEQWPSLANTAASWDNYWLGARYGEAFTGGGSTHPAVRRYWRDFFAAMEREHEAPTILDVGSGNGALVEAAGEAFGGPPPGYAALDMSRSAIAVLKQRFPDVAGIVGDARALPARGGAFDIAVSQFGVEYAGLDAVSELTRTLAPGGHLSLLVHHRTGGIFRQCSMSYAAIRRMQQARFLPLATAVFEGGFIAIEGGDRGAYERAARDFAPAIRAMEDIMKEYGSRVADDAIATLYRDVRTMHERMPRYARADVIGWLERMAEEVDAYAGRMASMCDAAIDEAAFTALRERVAGEGCAVLRAEPLVEPERGVPLAWILVARAFM